MRKKPNTLWRSGNFVYRIMYKETETKIVSDMYTSRRETYNGHPVGEASGWFSGNVLSYAYSCIIIYVLG